MKTVDQEASRPRCRGTWGSSSPCSPPRPSRSPARPTSSSTTAAPSTATSRPSRRSSSRPGSTSSCAAAPRPSCSSGCAAKASVRTPTCSSPPISRTCGAPRRPGCSSRSTRGGCVSRCPANCTSPTGAWWAISTRIRTPMRSTERVPAGAVTLVRGPWGRALQGPPVPAHVQQRVQPVARRRPDRQAGRGRDRGAAALLDGQRPADPRLGRRRARRDRRRPLRRRAHQPLLPRPRARGRPRLPGRARVAG